MLRETKLGCVLPVITLASILRVISIVPWGHIDAEKVPRGWLRTDRLPSIGPVANRVSFMCGYPLFRRASVGNLPEDVMESHLDMQISISNLRATRRSARLIWEILMIPA